MHISKPNVTLNIIPASQLASVQDQKSLIVCQKLAAGTAVSEALIQDHPNDSSEDTLLGKNSSGAGMVREVKKLNKLTRLDLLPIDDASGTQGTAVAAITGPAAEDGILTFVVGSEINHSYAIDITDTDSATIIGDALVAAITADGDAPFTAANVTGTVTITADQDGTLCNFWDIKVSGAVADVGVTLTGWTGGATDPTITTLLDAIANIRYQTIIWPSSFTITTLETDLDAKFNVTNDIKDGMGIQTILGTLSAAKSAVSALNSQSLCVIWNKTVATTAHKGAATPEMPDIISAQVGAIRALRLTKGAPLTQFLTSVAPIDQFGGIHIASLPYFNTLLPNLPIANAADFPSQEDQDEAESNGLCLIGPNKAFNGTIFGGMVTTYLTDAGANPDTSYKFLNSVDTASANREFFVNNYRSKYAQTRLTNGDLIAGKDMANEASIRAFSGELYDELSEEALTQAGRAAKKDFMDNLSIVLDLTAGSATVTAAPLMVSQLRVFLGTIQVNFGG